LSLIPSLAHAEIYTIRPGDNLTRIAHRLGIPLKALSRANSGLALQRLQPGDKIRLPREDSAAVTRASEAPGRNAPASVAKRKRANALAARKRKLRQLAEWKAYKKALLKRRLAEWKAYKKTLLKKKAIAALKKKKSQMAALKAKKARIALVRQKSRASWKAAAARKSRHSAVKIARSRSTHEKRVPKTAVASSRLVRTALAYRGARYVYGADGNGQYDCSGFTRTVYRRALGVDLPHSSREQYGYGKKISRDGLKPGDLLFFHTNRKGISHVGIYIGNGKFVHAANPRRGVTTDSLKEGFYNSRLVGARRIAHH
jgi:cell wall-associated NlpC family hydrolase